MTEKSDTKVCRNCGRELPVTQFPYRKDGLYRLGVCNDCRVSRNDMTAYIREMQRRRRERIANGYKPDPDKMVAYIDRIMAEPVPEPVKKEKPVKELNPEPKPERGCIKCWKYPCFEGIENFDTDFSKTCIDFHEKDMKL